MTKSTRTDERQERPRRNTTRHGHLPLLALLQHRCRRLGEICLGLCIHPPVHLEQSPPASPRGPQRPGSWTGSTSPGAISAANSFRLQLKSDEPVDEAFSSSHVCRASTRPPPSRDAWAESPVGSRCPAQRAHSRPTRRRSSSWSFDMHNEPTTEASDTVGTRADSTHNGAVRARQAQLNGVRLRVGIDRHTLQMIRSVSLSRDIRTGASGLALSKPKQDNDPPSTVRESAPQLRTKRAADGGRLPRRFAIARQ